MFLQNDLTKKLRDVTFVSLPPPTVVAERHILANYSNCPNPAMVTSLMDSPYLKFRNSEKLLFFWTATFIKRYSNSYYNWNKCFNIKILRYIFDNKLGKYNACLKINHCTPPFFQNFYNKNWIKICVFKLQYKFEYLSIFITNNFYKTHLFFKLLVSV